MKLSKLSLSILGASFLLSSAAFAGTAKGKLHLAETVTVEGKQLKPGDYNVEFDGSGPDVKLNITKGKDTIVSVPAHVTADLGKVHDGYGSKTEADGSKSLTSIITSGKEYDLAAGQNAAAATPAR
ncbi:MAG: hypothetical protein WCE52_15610 [Candidatus Acidiferrum sp.]